MLNRLLELLQEGGTHRVADLARELETTPELVEVMLEDLTRRGYLRLVGGKCAGRCGTCPLARTCTVGAPSLRAGGGRVWALAEAARGTGDSR